MQNTNSCPSCERDRFRRITVLGKELWVKNYICSADGVNYKKASEKAKLQLSIFPTSYCDSHCPFCIATETGEKKFLDLSKLRSVLKMLKEEDIVRGFSVTGGEPFTDVGLLNGTVELIFEIFGLGAEISINTNGINLHRIHEIEHLSYVDALHISRHHYDDKLNQSIFGVPMPGSEELKSILHSVSYRDLFVFNCMLLKGYIDSPEQVHKYLDFAIEMGAKKVSFITPTPINRYAVERRVDFPDVVRDDDPSLLFTRGFKDYEYCRCRDGVYLSEAGELIEFYGRFTDARDCEYCRGLSYTADDHLVVGYGPERII